MGPHGVFGTENTSWPDENRMDLAYQDQLSKPNNHNTSSSVSRDSKTTRRHLPLRQRTQPLPFILPHPLGPLPPPLGTSRQVTPATSRESTPRAFAPPEAYPWPNYSNPGAERLDGGGYEPAATPYPSFTPATTGLTRCQSLGTLTLPPSGGMIPPAPYPRRVTGPILGQPAVMTSSLPASPAGTSSPEIYGHPLSQRPDDQRALFPRPTAGSGPYPPQEPVVQYRCDRCPGVFASNAGLKRHRKVHSARKVAV